MANISAVSLNVKREQLLVINSESRGFYRVNYNKECWEKIIEQLLKNHTVRLAILQMFSRRIIIANLINMFFLFC